MLNVYTNLEMYVLFRNFVLRKMKIKLNLKLTTMNYVLKIYDWYTNELLKEIVYPEWPGAEAREYELNDFTIKCTIEKI